MFLYPQSVEDANNSGMNLLDQSVIKKGMDYSNKLDKLLRCSNIFMTYFYFGAINFSGKPAHMAARWIVDRQTEWREKGRYVKGKVYTHLLSPPSKSLITQMLSNGAPQAQMQFLRPPPLFSPLWSSMGIP